METNESRARALVELVVKNHEWADCGFQGENRSEICPVFKLELIAAIAAELAKE